MQKKSQHDFIWDNIDELKVIGENLSKLGIPSKENLLKSDNFYEKGWWMVIKESAIRAYISTYLINLIPQTKKYPIKLFFIDLLAGSGMCKVSKNEGRDEFVFPGSTMLGVWQNGYEKHFDEIISFDGKKENRIRIRKSTEMFNIELGKKKRTLANLYIPFEDDDEVKDSNEIIEDIIKIIEANKMYNYLCFVDNEGLDVSFETLKKLRHFQYGDLIINYQTSMIKRTFGKARKGQISWDSLNNFFGIDLSEMNMIPDELKDLYKFQLKNLGIEEIEEIPVQGPKSFHYNLLFCVRKPDAAWLSMVRDYNARFSVINDNVIKEIWDVIAGRTHDLDHFLRHDNNVKEEEKVDESIENYDEILNIKLYNENSHGFIQPLILDNDDDAWQGLLKNDTFDIIKLSDDVVLLKKILRNTELELQSSVIQGNIKERLGIHPLDTRIIILLDRETSVSEQVSFAPDGRLEGISFWLKAHKEDLQAGNYVFLSKYLNQEKIVIIIDYYHPGSQIIPFLKKYYKFYKEIEGSY